MENSVSVEETETYVNKLAKIENMIDSLALMRFML